MNISTTTYAVMIIYMVISFTAVGVKFRLQNRFYFQLPPAVRQIISVLHAAIVLSNVIIFGALAIVSRNQLELPVPIRLAGALAGLAGIYFIISSGIRLKMELFRPSRDGPMVKSGNYQIVRHPTYMGGILGAFGISLAVSSLSCLIYSGILAFVLYLVAWLEEKDLADRFGSEFEQMRSSVPMLLPTPGSVMRYISGLSDGKD